MWSWDALNGVPGQREAEIARHTLERAFKDSATEATTTNSEDDESWLWATSNGEAVERKAEVNSRTVTSAVEPTTQAVQGGKSRNSASPAKGLTGSASKMKAPANSAMEIESDDGESVDWEFLNMSSASRKAAYKRKAATKAKTSASKIGSRTRSCAKASTEVSRRKQDTQYNTTGKKVVTGRVVKSNRSEKRKQERTMSSVPRAVPLENAKRSKLPLTNLKPKELTKTSEKEINRSQASSTSRSSPRSPLDSPTRSASGSSSNMSEESRKNIAAAAAAAERRMAEASRRLLGINSLGLRLGPSRRNSNATNTKITTPRERSERVPAHTSTESSAWTTEAAKFVKLPVFENHQVSNGATKPDVPASPPYFVKTDVEDELEEGEIRE